MNLAWVHYRGFGAWLKQDQGANEARGFFKTAFYLHGALGRATTVVDTGEGLPAHPRVHLHVCPPSMFRPIPGKTNWLFTMWEGAVLPPELVRLSAAADGVAVPSTFCAQTWKRAGVNAALVPLGVPDPYLSVPIERPILRVSGRALRVLWVGSKSVRKGWGLVPGAWGLACRAFSAPVTLTLKTVGDGSVASRFGVTVDQRDLDEAGLLELYSAHDVVLSTSFAEGFGLPVLEGMAAGCLAVAPRHSGLADFVRSSTAIVIDRDTEGVVNYGGAFPWKVSGPRAIAAALVAAERNWGTGASEVVRHNGMVVARALTWSATAERLLEAIAARAKEAAA